MSTKTAPAKGTEKTKTETAATNGTAKTEAKTSKATFVEMTPRQKASAILKECVLLASTNDFKDIKMTFTKEDESGKEIEVTDRKGKKRIIDVRMYAIYKNEGKIETCGDADFEKVKEKAKLAIKSLKEGKGKYDANVVGFINYCLETLKGSKAVRGFNSAKVADWSLD